MSYTPAYNGGRFTVPPSFDFSILPQKTNSVAVISIIGSLDSFNQKTSAQLVEVFLKRRGFSIPCTDSVIQGYYDCERQLVFLHFRDSEQLLADLLEKTDNKEEVMKKYEAERLKHLYFLFLVSHIIVIATFGTSLDTRYIYLFKLLSKLRDRLSYSVDSVFRTLPLPRYCASVGRIATPRLLFVFKLPPTIVARKLAEDENSLFTFERNLTGQIFNVFFESGLLKGNSSESRLLDLMGYSYVRVLLPDVVEPFEHYGLSDKGDLAQELLESLFSAIKMPALLNDSDIIKRRNENHPNPLYPPPDRPDDRSFSAFLQSHLTCLLDDPVFRKQADTHTHYSFELPSVKSWFIACYKLYSSLMVDHNPDAASVQGGSKSSDTTADPSLSGQWYNLFHANPDNRDTEANTARPTSATLLSTQSQLYQRFSTARCEAALTLAEAHYRQDLPAHYSRTYHLAKVVSSYNMFLRHARGPCVVPTMQILTRRLARLYLAGRVGCPAVLVSGAPCQQELHRVPDRFPGIANAFRELKNQQLTEENEYSLTYIASCLGTAREMGTVESVSRKTAQLHDSLLSECLQDVPRGLTGQWRCSWIEAVLRIMKNCNENKESLNTLTTNSSTALHHLSVIPHRSDKSYISCCNCGRLQALRLDPFDSQEANWDFYNSLESTCCNKVMTIPLAPLFLNSLDHGFCVQLSANTTPTSVSKSQPVIEPSDLVPENCRQQLEGDGDEAECCNLTAEADLRDVETEETFIDARDKLDSDSDESFTSTEKSSPSSRHSYIGSLSQNFDDHMSEQLYQATAKTSKKSNESKKTKTEEKEEESPVKVRPKKPKIPVNFVESMPILGQPPGTLPLHPSWAVHALGKYFSYSHSSGLSYPGFLRGSNFLLPWDVQLSRVGNATSAIKPSRGMRQRDFDTVKLFIGFEMECPCGHRFFLAGPDRPMTGLMQGCDVRRTVSSLLACDLPLYLPCRCSPATAAAPTISSSSSSASSTNNENDDVTSGGSGVIWAQLMRVFVALPSAPIRVRFSPRVRPGPLNTPIFHLGLTVDQQVDSEISKASVRGTHDQPSSPDDPSDTTMSPGYVYLRNGFLWVARLPFAYQDGDQIYRRPPDPKEAGCCYLRGSLVLEEL